MWLIMQRALLLISLTQFALIIEAQDLAEFKPLDDPELLWEEQITPANPVDSPPNVRAKNGVFISPDQSTIVATSVGGTASAYNALSGEFLWMYDPPAVDGSVITCHSGVTFVAGEDPYMIYTVIDNEGDDAGSRSRVVALDMQGTEKWISSSLEGVAIGSPRANGEGTYVFQNTNSQAGSIGHFSIVSAADNGEIFYSKLNSTQAFGPLGIYHDPAEGYYEGENGLANTNDILMWSATPKPTDDAVGAGAIFAFQFPVTFNGDATDLAYILLGDAERGFQSIAFPVLANSGRSVYFSTSRSGFIGWVGVEGLDRFKFNRAPNANAGYDRGTPARQATFAAPALSSDNAEPSIFGGTASTQFVKLNHELTKEAFINTTSVVLSQAIVSPLDSFVYYIEKDGIVHQASFDDVTDNWALDIGTPIEGEFAIRDSGSVIYFADVVGTIRAFQVTEIPDTPAPTVAPTGIPSASPTAAPVTPTASPTAVPTPEVSQLPSDLPSLMPTGGPATDAPTPAATESGASQAMSILVVSIVTIACTLL